MEHFEKILDILAWPTVVLTALIMFRKSLEGLVSRIRSVEASNSKVLFDAHIQEFATMNRDELPQQENTAESKSWKQTLLAVAKLNPRAAIVEAWTAIELACIEAGMAQGTVGPMRFYPRMLEEFLDKTEGFDKTMIAQIMEMRKMRNLVIHGRDQDFGYLDSEAYIDLADKVLTLVKSSVPNNRFQPACGSGSAASAVA